MLTVPGDTGRLASLAAFGTASFVKILDILLMNLIDIGAVVCARHVELVLSQGQLGGLSRQTHVLDETRLPMVVMAVEEIAAGLAAEDVNTCAD